MYKKKKKEIKILYLESHSPYARTAQENIAVYFSPTKLVTMLFNKHKYEACGGAQAGGKDWLGKFKNYISLKFKRTNVENCNKNVTALVLSTNSDTKTILITREKEKRRKNILCLNRL
jgi:hypothetical protein